MEKDSAKFSVEEAKYYWQNQFTPSQRVGAVFILVLLLAGVYRSYYSEKNVQPVKPVLDKQPTRETKKPTKTYVYVHVAGAVKLPGVYRLDSNKRVIDAIKAAGGLQADAYPDALNLASKLKDGDKIYLPGKDEAGHEPPPGENSPNIETSVPQEQTKVNLNQATAEQLDTLPGIGPTLAKRIVEHRQTKGSFKKVAELQNVEGIGDKKFSLIKDKVTAQ